MYQSLLTSVSSFRVFRRRRFRILHDPHDSHDPHDTHDYHDSQDSHDSHDHYNSHDSIASDDHLDGYQDVPDEESTDERTTGTKAPFRSTWRGMMKATFLLLVMLLGERFQTFISFLEQKLKPRTAGFNQVLGPGFRSRSLLVGTCLTFVLFILQESW